MREGGLAPIPAQSSYFTVRLALLLVIAPTKFVTVTAKIAPLSPGVVGGVV
jgi:hypothetical protein